MKELISGLTYPDSRPDLILVNSPINDYTNLKRPETEQLPAFGLAYIATEVEKAGFNVGLLDVEVHALSPERATEILNQLNPRWVGINMLTPTFPLARRILAGLSPQIQVAAGAAHAKAMPEKVLRDPVIDGRISAIALEDGEYIMRGLVQGIDPSEMGGVAYIDHQGAFVHKADDPDKKWIPWELDSMPFADRKFLPGDPFPSQGRTETNMVGSRGCPFNCKFCAGARDMLLFGVRNRAPQNMVSELEMLREHGINAVRFIDDLFLANKRRMEGFFGQMIQTGLNQDFVWDATGRVNTLSKVDKGMLDLIAKSGCREVSIGAESGSPRVLEIMDKAISPEMVEETVRRLASVGVRSKGYFILGTPSETEPEMRETVRFMHHLRQVARDAVAENPVTPSGLKNLAQFRGSMFEFRPYPGTALYNYITGLQTWPEGIWQEGEDRHMYSEDTIIEGFQPVLMEGLEERQKHNYTTDLPFSDVKPKQIQHMIAEAMEIQRTNMQSHEEYLPGVKKTEDGLVIKNRETESR